MRQLVSKPEYVVLISGCCWVVSLLFGRFVQDVLFYATKKIFGLDSQSIISACDDNNHHISLNLKEHMDTNVQHIFILSSDHT